MKRVRVRKGSVRGNGKPAVSEQMAELPNGMWESIARKAYELYEQRGKRAGRELEDWFDAEAIVMEQIHEARE